MSETRFTFDRGACAAGRHANGRYLVSRHATDPDAIAAWIRAQDYAACEQEERRIVRHGRARNTLYEVRLASEPQALVMKVSSPSARYRLRRRVELYLQQLVKDHNYNAFRACCALRDAGVAVAEPIAWWRHCEGWPGRKSYFLYRKIQADASVADLLARDLDDEARSALSEKIVRLIRSIHAAGWRHEDLQMNNLLVANADGAIHVIDCDSCAPARATPRVLRRLLDLRCLIYLRATGASAEQALAAYLGAPPSPFQVATLRFWENGGFSLSRRSRKWRKRKRKRGAHLKN